MAGKGIERPTSADSIADTFKKVPTSKRKAAATAMAMAAVEPPGGLK